MLATGETLIKLNLNINMATMMTRRVNELRHFHANECILISMMLYTRQAEMMAYSLY